MLEIELTNLGGTASRPSRGNLDKTLRQVFPERIHKNSIVVKDAISAIRLGIRTEQRSIEFYTNSGKRASPKLRKVLNKLARMEIVHLGLLEENLHYLQSDGCWYGYLPILD